jgi:hypothetical protein
MVKLYKKYRCTIVAIQEVDPQETNKYGVIAGDEIGDGLIRVRDMVEKPAPEDAPSNLAIIGRYILTPDIFADRRNRAGQGRRDPDHRRPDEAGQRRLRDRLQVQRRVLTAVAPKATSKRPTSASRTSTRPARLTDSRLPARFERKPPSGGFFVFQPQLRRYADCLPRRVKWPTILTCM